MYIHAIHAYTGTYMHVPIKVRRGLWGAMADAVCHNLSTMTSTCVLINARSEPAAQDPRLQSACNESAAPLANVIFNEVPYISCSDAMRRRCDAAMRRRCNCDATAQTAMQSRRNRRRNRRRRRRNRRGIQV